jgi:hypothetical protein
MSNSNDSLVIAITGVLLVYISYGIHLLFYITSIRKIDLILHDFEAVLLYEIPEPYIT